MKVVLLLGDIILRYIFKIENMYWNKIQTVLVIRMKDYYTTRGQTFNICLYEGYLISRKYHFAHNVKSELKNAEQMTSYFFNLTIIVKSAFVTRGPCQAPEGPQKVI